MGNKHSAVVQFPRLNHVIRKCRKQRDDITNLDSNSRGEYIHQDIQREYVIEEAIGSGSYGEVCRCRRNDVDGDLAVKIMPRTPEDQVEDRPWSNQSIFRQEVELLADIDHEHIIRFWDSWEDMTGFFIVTEFCTGCNLFDKLLQQQPRVFAESQTASLAGQMLSAIAYLHDNMIMHRDIKAENFMLTGDSITSTVKLIDFGMATRFQQGEVFTEICGSTNYMAPEIMGQQYNHMADMWAFGVLIYLLVFGKYPFKFSKSIESLERILAHPIDWPPSTLMPATLDFMMAILEQNPGSRASSKQAQEHEFIQQVQGPILHSISTSTDSLAALVLQASVQESQETSSGQLRGICCTERDFQDNRHFMAADMSSKDHAQRSTTKARSRTKRRGAIAAFPGFWRRESAVFSTIHEALPGRVEDS